MRVDSPKLVKSKTLDHDFHGGHLYGPGRAHNRLFCACALFFLLVPAHAHLGKIMQKMIMVNVTLNCVFIMLF